MLDGSSIRRGSACPDTCHLLASGYDPARRTAIAAFDHPNGSWPDRLEVFHLNDSKKPCGSRVDRHEHIGKGCLGLEPFGRLLNDRRFAHLPMLIETEKTESRERGRVAVDPLDEMNLTTLRGLIQRSPNTSASNL